jgi:hypothetical protein
MATTYTGNPTATQTPGSQPGVGVPPAASLPADGDAANAASIAQAHKEAMDYIAWLAKPFGLSGGYQSPAFQTQSPNGKNRFTLDHFGLPAWGYFGIRETWFGGESVGPSAGSGTFAKLTHPWAWSITGTGTLGAISMQTPDGTSGRSIYFPSVLVAVDITTAANAGLVRSGIIAQYDPANTIVMEWAGQIDVAGTNGITWIAGMANASSSKGAFFRKLSTDTNWQCVTNDGSSETVVDSGIAGNTAFKRFKIAWNGSTVDDSAASRCVFFIDGVVVANITTHLPSSFAQAVFNGVTTAGSASVIRNMLIGPCHFTAAAGPLGYQ